MFTGIIERTLRIADIQDRAALRRLVIAAPWFDVKPGESIAINGACLTVAETGSEQLVFDVIQETLDKTNLGTLSAGDEVNAERALRVGDRFDGHFVQGHVDGVGELVKRAVAGADWRLRIALPHDLLKYVVPKGSIAIDGVSLTIAAVDADWFEVALIPTTLGLTTLRSRQVGWRFNIETDTMSKTIVRFLELRGT